MLPELPPLKEVVKRYSLTPQRSRGQHFLFDSNITDRIANTAELSENTIVYEVGPGPGGLTRSLLKRGVKKVIACETDPRCVQALEELVEYYPERLSIVHEDALLIHEKTHIPKGASIVSNLPYNISTALLFKWLQEPNQWSSMTLMFQREVANRLTAQPGGKNYGRISVIVQWLCHVKILFSINPASFVPPPKVVSSLISIKPRKEPLVQANRNYLEKVVTLAFGQRRKMIKTSLKLTGINVEEMLERSDISPRLRAEEIDIIGFCSLANALELIEKRK